MKKISVTTSYYLFKPHEIQSLDHKYYYIRVVNELFPSDKSWHQGYENHFGGVSIVGAPLPLELSTSLEAEFQKEIETEKQMQTKSLLSDVTLFLDFLNNT